MENLLYSSLAKNKEVFDKYFENAADYYFKPIKISGKNAAIVMCEDLIDSLKLWQIFLHPLNNLVIEDTDLYEFIADKTTIPFNPSPCVDFDQAMFFITAGFALILIEGNNKALVMPVQGYPSRGVDKPINESNLRGSKESFTDVGRKNMGMIRRRIRSKNLVVKTIQIGNKTKTEITVYYHTDYCSQEMADKILDKIKEIDLPVVMESGYIAPFIDDTKGSVFQAVGYTERPDTLCAKICEGKIGIMVDGTPFAMYYPAFFHENFITNDDYTQRPYFASFIRIIRYFSFLIAVALPGFYVAFTSFAPQAVANKLLFFVYSSQNSTPLPLFAEAVMITILLEIIKEAGLRLPAPIGSSVSIVAALIIGDAAVNAGLIGSAMLIVCGLSTISSFIVPSFYEAIIILRLVFIVCAGLFSIPGLAFATLYLFINIVVVNSAGYKYAGVFSKNLIFKDGITKASWRNVKTDFDLKEMEYENR